MKSALKVTDQEKTKDLKNKWTWIIGFCYFNIMDMLSTILGVTQLGAIELNPLMKLLLDVGIWPFVVFKILIGSLLALYLVVKERYTTLKYLTYLFGFVVLWNLIQLALTKLLVLL